LLTNIHLTAIVLPLWLGALAAGALWERWRLAFTPSPGTPGEGKEAARRSMRYVTLTYLCAIAYLATPMLPGAMKMLGQLQFDDVMVSTSIIGEMRPFYDGAFGKVSLLLVLLTVGSCIANRKSIRTGEWLWLAGMMIFLFRLGRFAPLFAIIAAPLAATYWPRLSDRPLRRGLVVGALGVFVLLAGVRIAINLPTASTPLDPWLNRNVPAANGYPTGAAEFVDAHVPLKTGHLINEFNWGGYLAWRLGDRYQTFMDGRTQMHPPQFWRDAFLGDETSRRSLVEDTDADVAILPKKGSVFTQPLQQMGWTIAWQDDQSLVMIPPMTMVMQDPE